MTYNIGDKVWSVEWDTKAIVDPCPVCNTNKFVVIRDGFGEEWQIECEYCRRGWEGPRGYVQQRYERTWVAHLITITGADISYDHENDRYYSGFSQGSRRMHYSYTLFPTQEEAQAYAEKRIADEAAAEYEKLWGKEHDLKSYSWHLGQYRADLKSTKDHLAFLESKIALFTEKAKEVQPGRHFKDRKRVFRVVEPVVNRPGWWKCQDIEYSWSSLWQYEDNFIMRHYCREPKETRE